MNFYHNLITDNSWKLLQVLRKNYKFLLIGGWAVFLYTHALKSKDIDVVVSFEELEKIKNFIEVSKNERLKKYETRQKGIEIDIYVPYYSNIGLPVEALFEHRISLEGFDVVRKEVLAVLKQFALKQRADSVKGRKDLIDLVSLFRIEDFDWELYKKVCFDYRLEEYQKFSLEKIKKTLEIKELDLNVHRLARIKAKIFANFD